VRKAGSMARGDNSLVVERIKIMVEEKIWGKRKHEHVCIHGNQHTLPNPLQVVNSNS
jgi:hypothetical protein